MTGSEESAPHQIPSCQQAHEFLPMPRHLQKSWFQVTFAPVQSKASQQPDHDRGRDKIKHDGGDHDM